MSTLVKSNTLRGTDAWNHRNQGQEKFWRGGADGRARLLYRWHGDLKRPCRRRNPSPIGQG
eukprot:3585815-Prymnesium_polylepis.1